VSSDDPSTPRTAGRRRGASRSRPDSAAGVLPDPGPEPPVHLPHRVDRVDRVDVVDVLEAAVLAVPGVHALHGGVHGEVATYLPGRRVAGIRLDDERCDVHVVLQTRTPLLESSERVRAAVRALVDVARVDVTVEDVVAGPS
jgi:hypothetical protein